MMRIPDLTAINRIIHADPDGNVNQMLAAASAYVLQATQTLFILGKSGYQT
jgi:hypothetical protein